MLDGKPQNDFGSCKAIFEEETEEAETPRLGPDCYEMLGASG